MIWIRELRELKGISLERMADHCGIDRRRLGNYELGRRRWPAEVWSKLLCTLGQPPAIPPDWCMSLAEHQAVGDWKRWQVDVDPGTTWATLSDGYQDLYRQLRPTQTPPLNYRELVRCDSRQESLAWTQLFEAGAQAMAASPVLLNFPRYPLIDHRGWPLNMSYRAVFVGRTDKFRWYLWPQLTLSLPDGPYRPDGLVLRIASQHRLWAAVQLDGGAHRDAAWDAKQDAKVDIEVMRFPSRIVQGLTFAASFVEQLSQI